MMEAMRILKASGVRLRRTVRIGAVERRGRRAARLEGVRQGRTSAIRATMQLKPEHAKLAGYFNVDNGTGAIRGVYLQGNEAVAPIFQLDGTVPQHGHDDADDPQHRRHGSPVVRRGRAARISVHSGSSRVQHAHAPFEHGRLQSGSKAQDMMRNAVIVASFVTMPRPTGTTKLPRKPLPPSRRRHGRPPNPELGQVGGIGQVGRVEKEAPAASGAERTRTRRPDLNLARGQ